MSEFKAGDWVKTQGHSGLMIIYKVTGEKAIVDVISRAGKSIGLSGYKLSEIEHASEDEIKAGHPLNDIKMEVTYGIKLNDLGVVTMGFDPGKDITHDLGDDSHIENRISPLCKSKDV
ncbi:hypothetical protein [Leifsonia sp. NPDC077715]|uniref:hypothetical protein n=1 Tax=Leifsonia sp. NPDC077715 TaxID=3155539 RepID=UPI003447C582